jgi:ribA/ribD-fused uncharacterized protein
MREWSANGAAVFRETRATWGIFSNFAPTPLTLGGITFRTAEALYQVCRFPEHPDVQRMIIEAKSPMTAKMLTKPRKHLTRSDWHDGTRVDAMRWTLRIKAQQSPDFRAVLQTTEQRDIIESSARDVYWGAVPRRDDPNTLVGENVLGLLIMELRAEMTREHLERVPPPPVSNFMILGQPVSEALYDFDKPVHDLFA